MGHLPSVNALTMMKKFEKVNQLMDLIALLIYASLISVLSDPVSLGFLDFEVNRKSFSTIDAIIIGSSKVAKKNERPSAKKSLNPPTSPNIIRSV